MFNNVCSSPKDGSLCEESFDRCPLSFRPVWILVVKGAHIANKVASDWSRAGGFWLVRGCHGNRETAGQWDGGRRRPEVTWPEVTWLEPEVTSPEPEVTWFGRENRGPVGKKGAWAQSPETKVQIRHWGEVLTGKGSDKRRCHVGKMI